MFYVLAFVLFCLVYYVFMKILSSMFKGCLVSVFILVVVLAGRILYKSTKEPVIILEMYKVDNFEIEKIE